jgi:hypothetical protein
LLLDKSDERLKLKNKTLAWGSKEENKLLREVGEVRCQILGVCSIFLRGNRSIKEIHKPRTIFSIKVLFKKYVFIYF